MGGARVCVGRSAAGYRPRAGRIDFYTLDFVPVDALRIGRRRKRGVLYGAWVEIVEGVIQIPLGCAFDVPEGWRPFCFWHEVGPAGTVACKRAA